MTTLKVFHFDYDADVPFSVDGDIVGVLHHNINGQKLTLLLEVDDPAGNSDDLLDPADFNVAELPDVLQGYDEESLRSIYAAEVSGKERATALSHIEDAIEAHAG